MAPLSHDLAGLILPHDHYGSHLDSTGRTVNAELEKANFQKAGETLAAVWSETVIDGFSVHAKYIEPVTVASDTEVVSPTQQWLCDHVQQSQYCLQIIKCNDVSCCGQRRTNYNEAFPKRFIPPPVPFIHTDAGVVSAAVGSGDGIFGSLFHRIALSAIEPRHDYKAMPFDLYCPSVSGQIHKRVCFSCGKYFPSQVALKAHKEVHKESRHEASCEDDGDGVPAVDSNSASGSQQEETASANGVIIVRNLFTWLQSEFTAE
jgi:hypothetical protein